jgi:sugar diacid utilization regulator
MPKMKNLLGMKFGRLTVLGLDDQRASDGQARWICLCNCGETTVVMGGNLTRGHSKSCGCWMRERMSKLNLTHGKSSLKIYSIWMGMLKRCQSRNDPSYDRYGGRGIKVCKRWQKFENFCADMGDPPPGMTLDRIDNDSDYSPENCQWATIQEQNNNKRNNRMFEYRGEEFTITQLARQVGMHPETLRYRLRNGWSLEKAVETPVQRSQTFQSLRA